MRRVKCSACGSILETSSEVGEVIECPTCKALVSVEAKDVVHVAAPPTPKKIQLRKAAADSMSTAHNGTANGTPTQVEIVGLTIPLNDVLWIVVKVMLCSALIGAFLGGLWLIVGAITAR